MGVRPGSIVSAGSPLCALVDTAQWWVDANFKETDLALIRAGESASIDVDMYPDLQLSGIVESVSPASGAAFSLLPPENATGNWVKVTQRFPVKVRVTDTGDAARALRLGESCSVRIDTRSVAQGGN